MPEDKKLEKILNILELADKDFVSPDEMGAVVNAVLDKVEADDQKSIVAIAKLTHDTDSEVGRLDDRVTSVQKDLQKTKQDFSERIARVKTIKGDKGDKGDSIKGDKGDAGKDGRDGKDGKNAKDITPEEVTDKVNTSKKLIKKSKIEGLEDIERIAKLNAQPQAITTSFINGRRAKNITFSGATVTYEGDTALVEVEASSGSGHTIQDEGTPLTQRTNINFVGAGVTVTDDAGNDATKVTIPSGGLTILSATGTVDDSNTTFSFTSEPTLLVINGGVYQASGGAITFSWSAPNVTLSTSVGEGGSIFGIA